MNRLVNKVRKRHDCEQYPALTGICMLLQTGGSNASCTGNHTYQFENSFFKLADLPADVKDVTGNSSSMRKVARAFSNRIFSTACVLGEPGNLYRKIQRMNPDITFENDDIDWCSDFQSNNPNCPERIRNLINKSFSTNTNNGRNGKISKKKKKKKTK